MATLTCTANALSANSACLQRLSKQERLAALVYYLWVQKNPTTGVGTVAPADSLLAAAGCLDCGSSRIAQDSLLDSFEVWIQRGQAISAGWTAGASTININALRRVINPLVNVSADSLRAIEISLRCSLVT